MWQRFASTWVKDLPFCTLTHCNIAQTHPKTFSTECGEDFPEQLHSVRRRPIGKPPTASAVGGFHLPAKRREGLSKTVARSRNVGIVIRY